MCFTRSALLKSLLSLLTQRHSRSAPAATVTFAQRKSSLVNHLRGEPMSRTAARQ